MNFRETLGRHLRAIERRDLDTLAATVADPLILVMADGQMKRSMTNWELSAKPVEIYENAGLGVAVLHLDYREDAKRSESYLTLVFEERGGEWLMVQDQNTPIR